MTSVMDATQDLATQATPPAQHLHASMAAVRLSFEWLGVRKTLSTDQKARAAQPFGAEGGFLSAAKKLLDTRHPAYRAVTAVKSRLAGYWRGVTLPFPQPGIRLIQRDRIDDFHQYARSLRQELDEAVRRLDGHYAELRRAARQRLGSLYDDADYPPSLVGLFQVEWDFPSVEPPEYLMQLNPRLYEQQRRRVAARFEEAVRMAEDAFLAEFTNLVAHLTDRLAQGEDGKPKVFRDSAVRNLHEFFERFRSLNVHSSQQLDELVASAQEALRGVRPEQLRGQEALRREIAGRLAAVSSQLEGMMVDRPRRRVLRPKATEAEG